MMIIMRMAINNDDSYDDYYNINNIIRKSVLLTIIVINAFSLLLYLLVN